MSEETFGYAPPIKPDRTATSQPVFEIRNDPKEFAATKKDTDGTPVKPIHVISNIVDAKTLRRIQSTILQNLSDILMNSFGPHGSNTCIKKLNAMNMYTKDGHTIIGNIFYNGIIEQSIKDDIESITANIADTVGDGTTSAVMMANDIFSILNGVMNNHPEFLAADIVRSMEQVGKDIDKKIRAGATPATLQDIYDIAYVASNGNQFVAQLLYSIYDTGGMDVFVDVIPTTSQDTTVKVYDGMTIDSGFADASFITDRERNCVVVDNPAVYIFEDPIDTKGMGALLDGILSPNIMQPIREQKFNEMVPTVIICPKLSRDMSSLMDALVNYQSQMPFGNKIPLNFVVGRTQPDQLHDIATLCGARPIFKYIDSEVYEQDVKDGKAPTPITVVNWAGSCKSVESTSSNTKIIMPALMKDENGNPTRTYQELINFVEAELKTNETEGGDIHERGILRRRLHSLKSNLVEIYVGGMSPADRDAVEHLIEDAVKNCRSAAEHGVGWGANFTGALAVKELIDGAEGKDNLYQRILMCVDTAYKDLIDNLYATATTMEKAIKYRIESYEKKQPINLRRMKFDGTIKSSIESDTIILNSVMKIVGLMVTCNQFATPSAKHNVYTDIITIE